MRGGEARGDSGGQSRPAPGEGREEGGAGGRMGCCASCPGGGSGNRVLPGRLRGRGMDRRLSCLWRGAPCLGPGPVLVLNNPSASGGEGLGLSEGWVRSGWRLGSVGPLLALGHVRWRLLWKAVFPRRDSLFGGAVSSLWPSGWDSRAWLWDRRCQRGATSVTLHWECAVSCTWPAEHSLFQSLFTSPVSPLPT